MDAGRRGGRGRRLEGKVKSSFPLEKMVEQVDTFQNLIPPPPTIHRLFLNYVGNFFNYFDNYPHNFYRKPPVNYFAGFDSYSGNPLCGRPAGHNPCLDEFNSISAQRFISDAYMGASENRGP